MKYLLIFCISIISLSSKAGQTLDLVSCSGSESFNQSGFVDIKEALKNLSSTQELAPYSASDFDVVTSSCPSVSIPSISEMKLFTVEKSKGARASKKISGISFQNEPQVLLDAFQKLSAFKPAKTVNGINFQEKYKINPACNQVVCAVKKIWGDSEGTKILYGLLKHGVNLSEYATLDGKSLRLNNSEINQILLTAKDLARDEPIDLFNGADKLNYSVSKTDDIEESTIAAASRWGMRLGSLWDESENELEKRTTLFHEFAHTLSLNGDLDINKAWLNISGWKSPSKFKYQQYTNEKTLVSSYGSTNPQEDFAESVLSYRYSPKYLKEVSEEKYEFIKKEVFNNKEFNSNGCTPDLPFKKSLEGIENLLGNIPTSFSKKWDVLYDQCSQWIHFNGVGKVHENTLNCLTEQYIESLMSEPAFFKKILSYKKSSDETFSFLSEAKGYLKLKISPVALSEMELKFSLPKSPENVLMNNSNLIPSLRSVFQKIFSDKNEGAYLLDKITSDCKDDTCYKTKLQKMFSALITCDGYSGPVSFIVEKYSPQALCSTINSGIIPQFYKEQFNLPYNKSRAQTRSYLQTIKEGLDRNDSEITQNLLDIIKTNQK